MEESIDKKSKLHHDHSHVKGNIKVAFFLNLTFTLIEIMGGFLTNSMAILSDALHDLGDSLSLGIAWFLEAYSQKKPDARFSFGYARFSLLGALLNSFILLGGSILILSKSVPRIFHPESVNPQGMLMLAMLGIVVNGLAVLRLKKGSSLNEKVVSWHLLEDVFGWAIILITSIVLMFVHIPIIDPLLSIALTLYVLFNVVKNVKSILNILMEGVPDNLSVHDIVSKIAAVPDVLEVHHTHIWSLEGDKNLLSTHIVLSTDKNHQEIVSLKRAVRELLISEGIEHSTIEMDFENEDCGNRNCLL